MNRRGFLKTPIILAPWVITTPGLLMPVRKIWTPGHKVYTHSFETDESDGYYWEELPGGTWRIVNSRPDLTKAYFTNGAWASDVVCINLREAV